MMLNHSSSASGFSSLSKNLNIEAGRAILKITPAKMDKEPKPMQIRCSCILRGTVLRDCPPNSTHRNWIAKVLMRMAKKRGLLKKLEKMLISLDFSFLALISLKTWSRTKTLKKIE